MSIMNATFIFVSYSENKLWTPTYGQRDIIVC